MRGDFEPASAPQISATSFAYSASSSESDGLPSGRSPHTEIPAPSILLTALSVRRVGYFSPPSENAEYFTPDGATIFPFSKRMESARSSEEQKSKK